MKRVFMLLLTLSLVISATMVISAPALAWGGDTFTEMSASATEVSSGDTVTLNIYEHNDGDRLMNVEMSLYQDGSLLYTLVKDDAYWVGGDTDGEGELDTDEVWMWSVEVTVTSATTFEVYGYGEIAPTGSAYYGWPVFWSPGSPTGGDVFEDPDEYAVVNINVDQGYEGLTPGFWKNHLDAWVGYAPGDDFDTIFGVDFFDPDITLEEALNLKGGKINALARHAVAALLSAGHPDVNYPMSEADIIAAVQAVDPTDDMAVEDLKDMFDAYNNLEADI